MVKVSEEITELENRGCRSGKSGNIKIMLEGDRGYIHVMDASFETREQALNWYKAMKKDYAEMYRTKIYGYRLHYNYFVEENFRE